MALVRREDIWKTEVKYLSIRIDEWDAEVQVRALNCGEQMELDKLTNAAKEKKEDFDDISFIVQRTIYDADKLPLFPPGGEGLEQLKATGQPIIFKLYAAAREITGIPDFNKFMVDLKKMIGVDSTSDSAPVSE